MRELRVAAFVLGLGFLTLPVAPAVDTQLMLCLPQTATHQLNLNGTWDRQVWFRTLQPWWQLGFEQSYQYGLFELNPCIPWNNL